MCARNREAPKDSVACRGPRLPARLLGQARNWGGFVQGGGGGLRRGGGTQPPPETPPPHTPLHPLSPSLLHACCFFKDMKGLKTRRTMCTLEFCKFRQRGNFNHRRTNPCLNATSRLPKTGRQIKWALFPPLCSFSPPSRNLK